MTSIDRRARPSTFLGALLAAACATAPPSTGRPESLPTLAGPVSFDGRSGAGAWAGARVVDVRGGTVRLGRVDRGIAVRTETASPSIATLAVAASDRIWLLHASAALGTGEYRCQADGRCSRTRDFEWSCRDTSDRPEAVACRDAFLAKEGWVANVDPEGGRVREFLIQPERFGGGPPRLVVTVLTLPAAPVSWPVVSDDAASLAVQQGALPEAARFDVARWLDVPR